MLEIMRIKFNEILWFFDIYTRRLVSFGIVGELILFQFMEIIFHVKSLNFNMDIIRVLGHSFFSLLDYITF